MLTNPSGGHPRKEHRRSRERAIRHRPRQSLWRPYHDSLRQSALEEWGFVVRVHSPPPVARSFIYYQTGPLFEAFHEAMHGPNLEHPREAEGVYGKESGRPRWTTIGPSTVIIHEGASPATGQSSGAERMNGGLSLKAIQDPKPPSRNHRAETTAPKPPSRADVVSATARRHPREKSVSGVNLQAA